MGLFTKYRALSYILLIHTKYSLCESSPLPARSRDASAKAGFEGGLFTPLLRREFSSRAVLKTGCAITAFFIISIGSSAQPSGLAGSFSRLGFGPRGMGMGNAFTAVQTEGTYGYYNPALAARADDGTQVDISTSIMSFDRTMNSLNSTFRLPPSAGINIALLHAGLTDIDGRNTSGYFTGDLATNEYQLLTAFGINVNKKIALGIGLKANLADYHSEISNARSFGFDIGALYKASESLSLGFTVQDLLASYSWRSGELYEDESLGESTETFPKRFAFGGSYTFHQSMTAALSYGLLLHENHSFQQLKVGGAWYLHERFSLRAGWQIDDLEHISKSNRPGAGFSLHLPFDKFVPSVDYAFIIEPNKVSTMHVFGLKFHL